MKLVSIFLLFIFLAISTFAKADELYGHRVITVECKSDSFRVYTNSPKTFDLENCERDVLDYRVKKLIIDAEGVGRDAQAQIVVEGEIKGTIYAPGRDPRYYVTIESFTNKFQIETTMGTLRINRIQVVLEESLRSSYRRVPYSSHGDVPTYGRHVFNESSGFASTAMRTVDAMRGYTNHDDYGTYLLPIKKQAARVYAVSQARGDLSSSMRTQLTILYNQLVFAEPFINDHFERDYAFELALVLLTLKDEIDDALD